MARLHSSSVRSPSMKQGMDKRDRVAGVGVKQREKKEINK